MLFHSATFALFFAVYLPAHILCPARWRLWLMIAGSAVFYGFWNWAYAGLPFALTLVAFAVTGWVLDAPSGRRTRRMATGLVVLLMPLAAFKYLNFIWRGIMGPLFVQTGAVAAGAADHDVISLGLPLGISFVTFTLIAYVVDVGRGRFPAPKLSQLLGYVLFFPHLIAGPILRPHELIPQLRNGLAVRAENIVPAVVVFCLGLVKKVVVADPLATMVVPVYAHPGTATFTESVVALYAFAGQLYCDFSGYTDMATGLAMLLNVRLPLNFNRPYAAESISEFWRRWHITLSQWLRDYVFFALGRGRVSRMKRARNMMVTMVLCGLWHGANWTFLLFGAVHGLAMVPGIWRDRKRAPVGGVRRWLRVVVTFHLVVASFVLFRAPDLATAMTIYRALLGGAAWGDPTAFLAAHPFECLLIPVLLALHPWDDNRKVAEAARRLKPHFAAAMATAVVLLAVAFGAGETAQFIYFDF